MCDILEPVCKSRRALEERITVIVANWTSSKSFFLEVDWSRRVVILIPASFGDEATNKVVIGQRHVNPSSDKAFVFLLLQKHNMVLHRPYGSVNLLPILIK